MNESSAVLNVGESLQLSVTCFPTNAKLGAITWSSSDHSVATVNASGMVTAVGAGNVTITATEASGVSATCLVTVSGTYAIGDVNNDGEISIPDVSMTVEYVLGREPNGGVREAADVNKDGEISIPDVSMIVSYILEGRTVQSRALQMREKRADNDVEYDERLYCSEISNENGYRHWLRLSLTDAADYTSAQFDVILPQGMKIVDVRMAEENTSHMVTFSQPEDCLARVLTYSLKNKNFCGFVDVLVECTTGSAYEVEICNVRLASKEDDSINSYRAEGLTIGLDATGIAGTTNAGNAIDAAYDLSGRKVNDTNRLPKGVYIVNGKKVIKK